MSASTVRGPRFDPPASWRRITVIDAHTEGEPLRVVASDLPDLPGESMSDRRRYAMSHLDDLRRTLMLEPRGHADMYGCIMTPPTSPDSAFGVLFLHNQGWSTMCGHGIIGVVTVAAETGMLDVAAAHDGIGIDTPAGRVVARALAGENRDDGAKRVRRVAFINVPSFVVDQGAVVTVPGLGRVRYDLAFGGAFYAYVDAPALGLALGPADAGALIAAGRAIKQAVAAERDIAHPDDDTLGFLYGTIFIGPAEAADAHSRNVCVFADGEVDRSPTGTGVSGRLAIHHARGEIEAGEKIAIESILGTRFTGRVSGTTRVGPYDAVLPEVAGRAWITGRSELLVAPDDPLALGFLLR